VDNLDKGRSLYHLSSRFVLCKFVFEIFTTHFNSFRDCCFNRFRKWCFVFQPL